LARGISTIGRSVLQDPDASSIGRESLIFDSRGNPARSACQINL
jgi:hypothetical protein